MDLGPTPLLALAAILAAGGWSLNVEEDKSPVYLTANVGSSVVFSCDLDFPRGVAVPYIINWNKDGSTVVSVFDEEGKEKKSIKCSESLNGRVYLLEASDSRVSINLTAIREPDGGWYECRLIIPNRTPSTRLNGTWFHLTINGSDLLGVPPRNMTVMDGETAKFECITKSEDARVTWYKDGVPLSQVPGTLSSRASISAEGSLTIAHTDITDPGLYKCQVTGPTGDSQSATAYLDVHYKARVVFTPREVYLPHGRDALLECHISANPPLTQLRWEKDGLLFDHLNVKEVYLSRNGSLYFSRIAEEHAGMYTCTPYNILGSAGPSLPIKVVVQHPPIFTMTPRNLYLRKIGDSVDMACDALDGDHRPTITWFKKDRSSLPEDRIVLTEGNLTINNLREEDRGLYECVASNEAATITTDTELVIETSSPRGPHDLTGNASANSVSLTWRPGFGASIHQYSIWMRLVDRNEWRSVKVKGPQATISSLESGRQYEFMVLSQDYSGEGMISKPLRLTTTGDPELDGTPSDELKLSAFQEIGAPRNLRVMADSEEYKLEWDEPDFGLDLLTYYMVLWDTQHSSGDSLRTVGETRIPSHTVRVSEDKTNYFQVRAVTRNNHYSTSEILLFYTPSQEKATLSLLLAGLIGFILAVIIVCLYVNRTAVRTRIVSLKSPMC